MKKILLTLFASLLLSTNAFATMQTPLFGHTRYSVLTASTTQYLRFGSSQGPTTTESSTEFVVPVSLTLSNLYIDTADPGFGNNIVFTVRKNNVDTALTCTATQANAGTCTDSTNTVAFNAGDKLTLQTSNTGLGGGYYIVKFSALATAADNVSFVYGNSSSGSSTSATEYLNLFGGNSNGTESRLAAPVPTGGTFRNFYVEVTTAPGSGKSYTFTLRKNNADTSVGCTISDTATSCNDSSDTVAFVAGDTADISVTPTSTPTAHTSTKWGIQFDPTTNGESFVLATSTENTKNTATYYTPINGYNSSADGGNGWTTEEWAILVPAPVDIQVKKLYATHTVSPGSGKSWQVMFDNDYASSALTCTMSDSATSCNDTTHTENVSQGATLDFSLIPTTSPSAGRLGVGMVIYIAPPSAPSAISFILVQSSDD